MRSGPCLGASVSDEYEGPRGWSGGSDDGPWQVAQSEGVTTDWAKLKAQFEALKERRAIRKAMLGPDRKPPDPTRTWSAEEAAPFLPPGRELRRCESLPRGYPEGSGEALMPWPPGPWDTEPDRFEWRSAEFPQLALLTVRNRMGAWCGYVGLPPGYWRYGVGYDELPLDAHGGLTFSDRCHGHICHEPAPGEPEHVWWLGFDCLHYRDTSPGMLAVRALTGQATYLVDLVDPNPLLEPTVWSGADDEDSMPGAWCNFDIYRPLWWVVIETENLARQCAEHNAASWARVSRALTRAVRHRARMGRRDKRRAWADIRAVAS